MRVNNKRGQTRLSVGSGNAVSNKRGQACATMSYNTGSVSVVYSQIDTKCGQTRLKARTAKVL